MKLRTGLDTIDEGILVEERDDQITNTWKNNCGFTDEELGNTYNSQNPPNEDTTDDPDSTISMTNQIVDSPFSNYYLWSCL